MLRRKKGQSISKRERNLERSASKMKIRMELSEVDASFSMNAGRGSVLDKLVEVGPW